MTKYSRQELLNLYSDSYPIPEGVERIKGVFIKESQTPKLLSRETLKVEQQGKRIAKDIDKQKKDRSQSSDRKQPVADIKAPVQWYYLDQTQKVQGPFSSNQLREWWDKQFFPDGLSISLSKDKQSFRKVTDVFGSKDFAFKFNPAAFPFIFGGIPADADPMQKLVYDFDFNLNKE